MRTAPGAGWPAFTPPGADRTLHLLLVEDSRADAELLLDLLEDELPDAVVSVAASLAEALPLLDGPLDVAITDLSLPDADGLQALTALVARRPDVAVVVMTGRSDHALALEALTAGAQDYLVKGAQDAHGVATAVLYAAARRAAEQQASRYERVALSLLDAMENATCAVDGTGTVLAVNQAWRAFSDANGGDPGRTGVGTNYLRACGAQPCDGDDEPGSVAAGLRGVLAGRLQRFEHEYPCHAPEQERWFSVRINPLPGEGAVVSHVDVSAAHRAADALAHLSLHDPLTDLPNRALLHDRLRQALAVAEREQGTVAVAFLDLDQFKRVNDSLGHAAGDQLLQQVAGRLRASLRPGDTLARISGDEFVVVLPDADETAGTEHLGERLAACFTDPFALDAATVTVTASIGLVCGRWPQSADQLLLAADAAMYDAKSSGRGRARVYTDELRLSVEDRLRTEEELRAALVGDELVVHYQPVVDLARGGVYGVEALVRWQHPSGMRQPDAFIPVAEASGLIVPLGDLVLREACRQAVEWGRQGLPLHVAVNFSACQISHPDVVSSVEGALRSTGLDPRRLLAEVTETTVMEDAERAQVALRRLADLGVGVAIDDFGTGYSSLLYLKRYPLTALKIDRSFVSGLGVRADDDAIVASVVGLARAVGALCIAEGVETLEQDAALRALGCDFAQGYLYSRPVPAQDVPAALRACAEVLDRPVAPRRPSTRTSERPVQPQVQRRVQELLSAGGSLHTIAAALNVDRLPNPYGRRWHPTTVAKVVATLPG